MFIHKRWHASTHCYMLAQLAIDLVQRVHYDHQPIEVHRIA
jgi:hypothetical protein